MSLNPQQITSLNNAIINYNYQPIYSFGNGMGPVNAGNIRNLEIIIDNLLRSNNVIDVQNGLASIVYWGNNTAGYVNYRTNTFNHNITQQHIQQFMALLVGPNMPTLEDILNIGMPTFSRISFISKILAFLDPDNHAVLDLRISTALHDVDGRGLNGIKYKTAIRVTAHNSARYYAWIQECVDISTTYFGGRYRAVDVERGFFNLISIDLILAKNIYRDA